MATTSEQVRRAEALGNKVNGAPEHISEVVPELLAMLDEEQPEDVLVAVIRSSRPRLDGFGVPGRRSLRRLSRRIGQVGGSPIDGGRYRIKGRFDHGGCRLDAAVP